MKAEITIYCDNEQELRSFVASVLSKPAPFVRADPRAKTPDEFQAIAADVVRAAQEAQAKPFERTDISLAERTDTEETPAPATTPPVRTRKPRSDAGQPRAPYKTTESAAPAAVESVGGVAAASVTEKAEQPAGAAVPTREDAHAALKRMHEIKGMGTPATIKHLQEFGTDKLSLLDPKHFPLFIAGADAKVAAFLKAAPAA